MSNQSYTVSVILVAGGKGTRMNSSIPKQFLKLKDKPVALYSYELLLSLKNVKEIIVVCDKMYRPLFPKGTKFADSGERRQDSVKNGLQEVSPDTDLVCIHDSARPFLAKADLCKVLDEAWKYKAAALAVPMKYTIKQTDEKGFVLRTLDRSTLWQMNTPQVSTLKLYRQGLAIAEKEGLSVTDDAALVELTGHPVKLVQDSYNNFKITTPEDWALAEKCISSN